MSMDRSEVKKIIDDSIGAMRNALCLNEWDVDVIYETIGVSDNLRGATMAISRPDPKYMDAELKFDPEQIDSEKELLDTLRHELLHFVHADMQIMRRVVGQMLTDSEFHTYGELYSHAAERIVHRIEMMLNNLGITPEALVAKGLKDYSKYKKGKKKRK